MSFETLKARLIGSLDILPPSLASNFINDALFDIYNSHDWSFLRKEDFIRTPALIYQGSVSVTKYSNQVTLDATASAIVFAITANEISLIERQFRTFSPKITGRSFLYNIIDFDTTNPAAIVLTIDPYFLDETNSAVKFQILKAYYTPPSIIDKNNNTFIDFRGWDYFISLRLQRRLWLDSTLEELNNFDPARFYVDEPHHVVAHPADAVGNLLFELYPAPRFERVYRVTYRRKGVNFDPADQTLKPMVNEEDILPRPLTEEFVLTRAKYRMYEWAIANSDKLKISQTARGTGASKFVNLMALLMNANDQMSYPNQLLRLIKEDEELYPRAYLGSYTDCPYFESSFDNLLGNYGLRNTVIIAA